MPIYEVLPEQGNSRGSRILHRNLLLPCDHLPLEIQLQPAKSKREITTRTSRDKEQPHQDDDGSDSDNDCEYYHMPRVQPLPVMQPQVNTHREDPEVEITETSQDVEHRQQGIPQLQEAQGGGDVLNEEDMSGKGAQEEIALGERTPAPLSPVQNEDNNDTDIGFQRPVRDRRPTTFFTYDQLGNPVCCSANIVYWYPPLPYATVPAIGTWMTQFNYQPVVTGY